MNGLRKAFAGLLMALTLPVSLVTAWNHGIFSTYLNQNFYRDSFFEETLYPAIINRVTEQIIGEIDELGQYVSREDIQRQLEILIPIELLQTMIDDLFEQIEQKPFPKKITVSFEGIKKNVPQVVENIATLIEEKTEIPFSRASLAQEFQSQVEYAFPDSFEIPTQEILKDMTNEQYAIGKIITDGRAEQALRWGLWVTWGALLIIMGLLIFSRNVVRWWGITLTLNALSILGISQILKEGLAQAIQETEWIEGAILFQPIFKNITILGLSVLSLGIAFILSQYWLKPHHAQN